MAVVVGSAQRANIQYCIVIYRYCAQPGKPRGKRKVERNSMSGDFFPLHSSPKSHHISWLLKHSRLYRKPINSLSTAIPVPLPDTIVRLAR